MSKIAHGWRIARTGACYIGFGIGGVAVILLAAVLRCVPSRSKSARQRRMRRVISSFFSAFLALARVLGLLEYRFEGASYLRRPGCLIVANHPSLIDVVFLIAFLPEADCVVKQALWHNPFTGVVLRQAGYTSNADGPELIERGRASLTSGNSLIIFPEGTRSRPGQPLRLQRGAAHIALAAGAEIVPVVIRFAEPTLFKGEPWYHVPSGKIQVSMRAHCSFDAEGHGAGLPTTVAARRVTALIHKYFTQRLA